MSEKIKGTLTHTDGTTLAAWLSGRGSLVDGFWANLAEEDTDHFFENSKWTFTPDKKSVADQIRDLPIGTRFRLVDAYGEVAAHPWFYIKINESECLYWSKKNASLNGCLGISSFENRFVIEVIDGDE